MRLSAHEGLLLKPLGFTLDAYKLMAKNPMILRGYGNTLFILALGLVFNMTLTCMGAYVMSRTNVLFGKAITMMIIFTMYFSGGLIPFYLTVKQLGMENSLLALIVPSAINTFNLIIMRTSFAAISLQPGGVRQAGRGRAYHHFGADHRPSQQGHHGGLSPCIMRWPHWNSWFNAMIFLTDRKLFPLQLILREILIQKRHQLHDPNGEHRGVQLYRRNHKVCGDHCIGGAHFMRLPTLCKNTLSRA